MNGHRRERVVTRSIYALAVALDVAVLLLILAGRAH